MQSRKINHITYLITYFIASTLILSLVRVLLICYNLTEFQSLPQWKSLLVDTLIMGFRFDAVITCYILALPILILSITTSFGYKRGWLNTFLISYFSITTAISLLFSLANIPYYSQFNKTINSSIFNWIDDLGFVSKMILQESSFVIYLILFIALMVVVVLAIKKITHFFFSNRVSSSTNSSKGRYLTFNITLSVILLGLCFIGGRGRLEQKSPIRVGTAYFSQYNLPNQLAQNASFTLLKSYLEDQKSKKQEVILMPTATALAKTKEFLKLPDNDSLHFMDRTILPFEKPLKANVVLVIMEGMSANYMRYFNHPKSITPFLDSLALQSYFFENYYTAGVHTMNGIYSTLFSFPSFLKKHPLKISIVPQYQGIAKTLQEKGYSTLYFTTHDDQFDNVGGFIKPNGFDRIISQKDYPSKEVLSTLGVPDDYMFRFAKPVLNQTKEPFFATLLTISNHTPFIVPNYYKPTEPDRDGIIQYSDWSIKMFIESCKQEPWFENTIFVFTADHGTAILSNDYAMPLAYQHSPLIIYSPKFVKPQIDSKMAGQIDIYPTIMGLLNESYTNNTFGIDLIADSRPYIYFTADDKIGCLDSSYFYVNLIEQKIEKLYDLKRGDRESVLDSLPDVTNKMREYALSMLQASEWVSKRKR